MEIPPQSLPQAVAAARLALTEALVLKVGQTLEALVVGKGADGTTELKIGDAVVTAKLAQNFAVGTRLQLQVKSGGAAAHLAILSVRAPGTAAGTAPRSVVSPRSSPVLSGTSSGPTSGSASAPAGTSESPQALAARGSQIESGTGARPAGVAVVTPEPEETGPVRTGSPQAQAQPPPAIVRTGAGPSLPVPSPTPPSLQTAPAMTATPGTTMATGSAAPVVPAASEGGPDPAPGQIIFNAQTPSKPGQTPAPNLVTQAVLSGGVEAEAEAQNALLQAQAAPRPAPMPLGMPRVSSPPSGGAPAIPAPVPQTPQAALAQMLPEALARQDSIGPLLRTLAQVLQAPMVLPEPIVRAAVGLLAQRISIPDGKVAATDLEQAVARSGVGLEASLAKGTTTPGDAKAALLGLRDALSRWLGEAKPATVAPRDPAPPPLKGLPMRMPDAGDPPPLPDTARDAGRLLHAQADSAVSRIKLMQVASLPDADPKLPAASTLRVEVPFLVGHELVMAQIQIGRESRRRDTEQRRGWTMRFALNFSATGEVGAEVGLLGKAVNVSLWAVEPETAEALAEGLPDLQRALEAIGLDPGPIRMRQGVPEMDTPVSGRLLDSTS